MNLQQKFTKPRKAWMFVLLSGVGHSWTPVTLTGSMETSFSEMTRPKYSIHSLWNSYFSGQRKSLFSCKIYNTYQIACICSSSVLVKIRMLSRQTTIMPSAMRFQKMLFIMVWKVARLLVILKNITKGLNRPVRGQHQYRLGNLVGFTLASVLTDSRSPRYLVPTSSSSGLYHSTAQLYLVVQLLLS